MPRTKYVAPEPAEEARNLVVRFRVNGKEWQQIARRAKSAGFQAMSEYQRHLNQLPPILSHHQGNLGGSKKGDARKIWVRFRVNAGEWRKVSDAAGTVGCKNIPTYQRQLNGLPEIAPGAPEGNQNKAGKPGANRYTKRAE